MKKPSTTKARYCRPVVAGVVDWRKVTQQSIATKQRARPVSMPSSSQRTAEGATKITSVMRPRRRARWASRGYRAKEQEGEAGDEEDVDAARDDAGKVRRGGERAKEREQIDVEKTRRTIVGMHAVVGDEMRPEEIVGVAEMDEGVVLDTGPRQNDPRHKPQA